ncbi:MAG: CPBP family intramembrane metalloprotease [Clostridia bacterium]|nr:CPBP family intramembrane metalloprotease [Clostridia bacterium]
MDENNLNLNNELPADDKAVTEQTEPVEGVAENDAAKTERSEVAQASLAEATEQNEQNVSVEEEPAEDNQNETDKSTSSEETSAVEGDGAFETYSGEKSANDDLQGESGLTAEQSYASATTDAPAKEKISFGRTYGHFTLIFGSIFAFVVAAVIFQSAAVIIIQAFFPQLIDFSGINLLLSVIPMYCVGLPVAVIVLLFAKKGPAWEKQSITFGKWLKLFCVTAAVMYLGNIVGNIINSFISFFPGTNIRDVVDEILGEDPFRLPALITVVIAPVVEELIFRKMFIDRMRGYGEKFAIFISALCFGLFHGNFSQFFYAFGIGLVFGYVYSKTRNLWYTVSLHAAANLFFGVISALVANYSSGLIDLASDIMQGADIATEELIPRLAGLVLPAIVRMLYLLLTIALVVCGVVFFIIRVRKKISLEPAHYELASGKLSVAAVWANVGFWLFAVLTVITFLSSIF